jgi:hypothetical protein
MTDVSLGNRPLPPPRIPILVEALALGAGLTVPVAADATLMITDINQTLDTSSSSLNIDLNTNGLDDFQLVLNSVTKPKAFINAGFTGASGQGKVSTLANGVAVDLPAGSAVNGSYFDGTNGGANSSGYILTNYGDPRTPTNPWMDIGAHGFVGLYVATTVAGQFNYGWLELTTIGVSGVTAGRGLMVGRMGYETVANTAAQIPETVPEPGTLLLLVSGAAGIAAMRRRQRAATH